MKWGYSMTEKKRLKKVRRRNKKMKSFNFETKTLKRVPILSERPSKGKVEERNYLIEKNKILRGNRINGIY